MFLGSGFEWIFIDWKKKGPFSLADATVITVQHNTQLNTIVRTDHTNTQGQKRTPVLVEKKQQMSLFFQHLKCSDQTSVENYPCVPAIAF